MMDSEQKLLSFKIRLIKQFPEQNLEIEKIQTALDKDAIEITKEALLIKR